LCAQQQSEQLIHYHACPPSTLVANQHKSAAPHLAGDVLLFLTIDLKLVFGAILSKPQAPSGCAERDDDADVQAQAAAAAEALSGGHRFDVQ
jgi:hypothetical protein